MSVFINWFETGNAKKKKCVIIFVFTKTSNIQRQNICHNEELKILLISIKFENDSC